MQGTWAEGEERDRLTAEFGNIPQAGTWEDGLVEIVILLESQIELSALIGSDESDCDLLEDLVFRRRFGSAHSPAWQ